MTFPKGHPGTEENPWDAASIAQLIAERDAARAEVVRLRKALAFIHEMAEEDVRCDRVSNGSSLWQIEAEARAALAAAL